MKVRTALLWSLAGCFFLGLNAVIQTLGWDRHLEGWELTSAWFRRQGYGGLLLCAYALLVGIPYLRVAFGTRDLELRDVLMGGLVLAGVSFLIPAFLSADVYDYLARGRVESIHGANPYTTAPAKFPDDPFISQAHPEWREHTLPYGPILALVQATVSEYSGSSSLIAPYDFKLVFGLCHVLTAWLLYQVLLIAAAGFARRGLFLYLWNPWLLLEFAGNAHNDSLMTLFLAAMFLYLFRERMAMATFAFGCAVLTKHSCAILGPLLLILAWRQQRLPGFLAGFAATVAATALLSWHYFLDDGALEALVWQVAQRGASLQHFLLQAFGDDRASLLTIVGYAISLTYLGWVARRVVDAQSFAGEGARAMLVFTFAGLGLFSPWYSAWWLPLLLIAAGRWSIRAFGWMSMAGVLSYMVFLTTHPRSLGLDHQMLQWSLCLLVPTAMVLAGRWIPAAQGSHNQNSEN